MSEPYNASNVEGALEGGYGATAADDKPKEYPSNSGYIPAKHQGYVVNIVTGFVTCFLADFGARQAYETYNMYRNLPDGQLPSGKLGMELLFKTNIVMGAMYLLPAIFLIFRQSWFFNLFWNSRYAPPARSTHDFLGRNMGLIVLGCALAQLIQPSNEGVGLVALTTSAVTVLNFIAATFFDRYEGLINRNIMWPMFVIGGVVFTALFSYALHRQMFFARDWKNQGQHQQVLLFYLNMISGLSYTPLAIINMWPGGAEWFMGFFFSKTPFDLKTPSEFFKNNMVGLMAGLAFAQLISPTSTGVGVVSFFVFLLQIPNMILGISGFYENTTGKMFWASFLVSSIVFTALYGYALVALDDCKATDANCGQYSGWMDRKWKMDY